MSSTTTEISDFVLKESSTDNSNSDAVISDAVISEAGELFDGTPLPQISKSVTIYQLKNLGGKCSLHEVRNTQMVKKKCLVRTLAFYKYAAMHAEHCPQNKKQTTRACAATTTNRNGDCLGTCCSLSQLIFAQDIPELITQRYMTHIKFNKL